VIFSEHFIDRCGREVTHIHTHTILAKMGEMSILIIKSCLVLKNNNRNRFLWQSGNYFYKCPFWPNFKCQFKKLSLKKNRKKTKKKN